MLGELLADFAAALSVCCHNLYSVSGISTSSGCRADWFYPSVSRCSIEAGFVLMLPLAFTIAAIRPHPAVVRRAFRWRLRSP